MGDLLTKVLKPIPHRRRGPSNYPRGYGSSPLERYRPGPPLGVVGGSVQVIFGITTVLTSRDHKRPLS